MRQTVIAVTVAATDNVDVEKDEDDGYKKPAGLVIAFVGSTIGLVATLGIFWFLLSHRYR